MKGMRRASLESAREINNVFLHLSSQGSLVAK